MKEATRLLVVVLCFRTGKTGNLFRKASFFELTALIRAAMLALQAELMEHTVCMPLSKNRFFFRSAK
jgi:hypothetical protein